MTRLRLSALVAISALAFVACGNSEDGTPVAVATSSAAPGQQELTQRAAPPRITLPPLVLESQPPASGTAPPPTVEAAPTQGALPAVCLALGSPMVSDAVASLPPYSSGVPWVAYDMGDPCANFTWVAATSEGATASTPDHYLFFAGGDYLGTATSAPYSFSSVVDQNADTVTIGYRWLVGDEAFADPQGGPALVRYRWDGTTVTMLDELPPQVTG